MSISKLTPLPSLTAPPAVTLAERFWSIARGMELDIDHAEPVDVVRHVLRVLDALDRGDVGSGLTKNTVSFLVLLRQHEMMGDLLYAAPEQARGEGIDERSLVFSVGVLLFEKLTGRHPFGAEGNAKRMARIRKGELGSGVSYFPKLPAGLRTILVGAMGPFPEDRWESLSVLRKKLVEFVAAEVGPEPPKKRAKSFPPPLPNRLRPRLGTEDESTQVRPHTVQVAEDVWAEKTDPSGPGFPIASEPTPSTESSVVIKMAPMPTAPPPAPAARPAPVARLVPPLRQDSVLPLPLPAPALVTPSNDPAPFFSPDESPRLVSEPPLRRRPSWILPVACSVLGAGVASVVFLVVLAKKHPTAQVAAAVTPAEAPAEAPPVLAYKVDPTGTPAPVAPASLTTAAPAAPVAAPAAPAGAFDPMIATARMLERARACITPARLHRGVSFGVGVLFSPGDGFSHKLYWATDSGLETPERQCLGKSLIGMSSGAPPLKGTIVEYRFKTITETTGVASFIPEKPPAKRPKADPVL